MQNLYKFVTQIFSRKSPAKLGLFIFLSACSAGSSKIAKMPVVEVNGATLNAKEFSDLLAKKLVQFDALAARDPVNVSRAKEEIVQDFVMNSILKRWAIENQIALSESAIDTEINRIRASFPNDLAFRQELATSSLSLQDWRKKIADGLLEKKVVSKLSSNIAAPTKEEMLAYYNNNKEKFKIPEQVYLRQIVLKEESDAEKILEALKTKPFEGLATSFSIAPEANNGGLVGWVEKGSVDFFEKAFSLPIGTISPLIQSPYGFHLIKIEKKRPAGLRPFEESQKSIARVLRGNKEQAAFSAWLDSQLRSSKILRNNDLIRGMTVETRKD